MITHVSLIIFAVFSCTIRVHTFRQSVSRIMTPNGQSPNSLPQQNFIPPDGLFSYLLYTPINSSMMLTTPAPNTPMTTGTVVTPAQVTNPPLILIANASFTLNGSTVDVATVPSSSSAVSVPSPALTVDIAYFITGTVTPASIPTAIPAPVDLTTSLPSINVSFMLSSSTEATVASNTPSPVASTSFNPTIDTASMVTGDVSISQGLTPIIGTVTTGTSAIPFPPTTETTSVSTDNSPVTDAIVPLAADGSTTVASNKKIADVSSNDLSTTADSISSDSVDSAVTDTNENDSFSNETMGLDDQETQVETTTSTAVLSSNPSLNASLIGPIYGIVIPTEIKIILNISISPISVDISTDPPVTEVTEDTEIIKGNQSIDMSSQDIPSVFSDAPVTEVAEEPVEIIEGKENTSMLPQSQDIIFETSIENTVSESHINIDLSDPNNSGDFGKITTKSPMPALETSSSSAPSASPPFVKKPKFEEKCLEYYNIGSRKIRKTQVQVFIIGGQNSEQKEFPHMAALGYGRQNDKQWLCGGSLISENYVVTAAHCLIARAIGEVRYVRLGTTTLQTETLNSEDFDVIRRIPHPSYVQGNQYNDIALIQLDRPVEFSDYIAPICLLSQTDFTHAKLMATGWGKTEADGEGSKELKKVELDYFPNDVCQRAYNGISVEELNEGISEETQLCAGAIDGSRDTCQGDSGGPLQLQQDGRMYLIGITSFGIGCGKADSPGVYTRVSYYIPWIENIVWGA